MWKRWMKFHDYYSRSYLYPVYSLLLFSVLVDLYIGRGLSSTALPSVWNDRETRERVRWDCKCNGKEDSMR